jgi:hypothetical protein
VILAKSGRFSFEGCAGDASGDAGNATPALRIADVRAQEEHSSGA